MFQCPQTPLHDEDYLFITVMAPHIVLVITALCNLWSSRQNSRGIQKVERALNGKAISSEEEEEK